MPLWWVVDVLARQLDTSLCEAILRSSRLDASRRADFAHALGRTGRGAELLPMLLTLTGHTVVRPEVRDACARASGELGETSATTQEILGLLSTYKTHPIRAYRGLPPVDTLFRALWRVSRRVGLLVLPSLNPDAALYAYRLAPRVALDREE